MERFYKRKVDLVISQDEQVLMRKKDKVNNQEAKDISFTSIKNGDKLINLADLEADPGLRIPICDYNVNDQDEEFLFVTIMSMSMTIIPIYIYFVLLLC